MMIPLLSLLRGPEVEMDVHFEVNMKIRREKRPPHQSLVRGLLGLNGPQKEHLGNKEALRAKSKSAESSSRGKERKNTSSDSSPSKKRHTQKKEKSCRRKISKTSHKEQ